MKALMLILSITIFSIALNARGRYGDSSANIQNFNQAKKYLSKNLDLFDNKTIYCSCTVRNKSVDIESCGYKVQSKKNSKRAHKLEWEHVVPAEAFGNSFSEWREGGSKCEKRGRKCAERNPEFSKMESDLYNLFPEIGELNGLRNNFSMAALTSSEKDFGGCKVRLENRKFEPQDSSKGIVARTYLNFDNQYPHRGIVSDKNKRLFEGWDKEYPITNLECRRWKTFERKNGYKHLFASKCP